MKVLLKACVCLSLYFLLSWAQESGAGLRKTPMTCQDVLGESLSSYRGDADFAFDLSKTWGPRGYLGSVPKFSGRTAIVAGYQGVFWWGQSFGVQPTVEKAREHDQNFIGLGKIYYFISSDPEGLSGYSTATPAEVIQREFRNLYNYSWVMGYFEDVVDEQGHPGPARFVPLDKTTGDLLLDPFEVGYVTDDRGPRIGMEGWVFPFQRGVITYQSMFESESKTIEKLLKEAGRLVRNRDFSITFNERFEESLDRARLQDRSGVGSIYSDQRIYEATMEKYQLGSAFSVEVVDGGGQLVGGIIGSRYGNLYAVDTVFYDVIEREGVDAEGQPLKPKGMIDYAKMATIALVLRLKEAGIDMVDVQITTPFTRALTARYIDGQREFRPLVRALNSQPPLPVDLSRPWQP